MRQTERQKSRGTRKRALVVFMLAAMFGLVLFAGALTAEIVEATVAKVGRRLIFLSEIRENWHIERVQAGKLEQAARKNVPVTELERILKWKLKQVVVLVYLDKLGLWKEVDPVKLNALERDFSGKFKNQAAYKKFLARVGLQRERLLNLLWEQERVQIFIREKLQATGRRLEDEIERFVDQEQKKISIELLPWKKSKTSAKK